ncbi:alpha/beta hydrolase [Verrucomicrobiales bacterium]|nr:alpha/beta hydrolase [bacterium]MDB4662498.1 alpha/beta hydrolase [Verrucomicrobiales bacterium]MDC0258748.1 alpha/beta hydrolase [Verrucomicrobiales bacterium]
MKRSFILALLTPLICLAGPQAPIELWPAGEVPGEKGVELPEESSADKNKDGVIRISNVSVPTMTFYPAPAEKNTGTAVVVAPGGGYSILAYSHEGSDVCDFLNSIGVNAILLKYRVPRREGVEKHHAPLQDAQRAISMVRKNAEAWKINPERVGMLGFSAGGHLTVLTMTSQEKRSFEPDHENDIHSCVPNFTVPIYPAYLKNEKDQNALSPEIVITEKTPPTFITVAHGDRRFAEGSALLYLEMFRKKRQCELHIYGHGGHGFGIKDIPEKVSDWPERLADWMGAMGYLTK